jgi:hypothetical protein
VPYSVTMRLTAAEDHQNLESSIDRIMEELVRLTEVKNARISDPNIGADLAAGRVEFSLTVDAAEEDVTKEAVTAIRTAIHAAGQGTPGWPTFEEAQELSAERVPASA